MKPTHSKFLMSLLVVLLSVSFHACQVEQALASLLDSGAMAQHEEVEHHGHSSAPSHAHDEAGREGAFCCDNPHYTYLATQVFIPFDRGPVSDAIPFPIATPGNLAALFTAEPLSSFWQIPDTPRGRDRYALTCLLHAPPES